MYNKGLIAHHRDDEEQSFVERNLLKLKNALERKVRTLIARFKALPDSAKVVYILQKILLLLGDARFAYLVFYKYNFVIMYKKYVKALKSHVLESASMKEMLSDLAQVAFFTTYHKFVSALGDKVIKHIVNKHKKQRGDSAMKNKIITHDSMPWTKHMARRNYFIDAPDKAAVSKSIKKLEQIESQADKKLKETNDSIFSKIKGAARRVLNLMKGNKGIKVIAVVAATAVLGSLVAAATAKYKGDKTVKVINNTAKEAQEAVNKTVENINKTQEEVNKAAQEFAERMNNSKSKTDSIKRYIDAKVEREVRRRFYDANIEDIKAKLVSAGQKLKQTGSATADKTVQKIKGVLQLIKNNPCKAAAIGAGLAAIAGAAAFGAKRAKDRKEAMLQQTLVDFCNLSRRALPSPDSVYGKIGQAEKAIRHSEEEDRRLYEQYKNSKHDSFF